MVKEYFRPRTASEAMELKETIQGSRYLAGGSVLLSPEFHNRDFAAISLSEVLGRGIRTDLGDLEIGALASFQDIADSLACPQVLREAALGMKNRAVRNRATIGGNVCANKSSSSLIPVLLILDARAVLGDEKMLSVAELIGLPEPPLVCAFRLPIERTRACAYSRWSRTANDIAIVSAAASLVARAGEGKAEPIVHSVRLALGGVAKTVVRLTEIETLLEGRALPERESLESEIASRIKPIGDQRGSVEFKRRLASALGAEAILACAREGSS